MSGKDNNQDNLLNELDELREGYRLVNERVKVLEEELRKSESKYNSILQSFPDVLTITDLEGKILYFSSEAYEMFGLPREHQFINRNILEYIDPRDHEKAVQGIREMLALDFKGATEYRGLKGDGTSFSIEVNGRLILDEKGEPSNMIFLTRDITKRKQTEDLLERTEERFRRMVENINDVIYEVDTGGIVRYVSPSIERIVGYTPEELTGRNFFEFMYPDDRPRLMQALANLGKSDFSFLEYRYMAKDGSVRWVRSSTKAIIREGKLVGGVGSLTDLTDRKMYEEKLLKLTMAVEQSPVMIVITDLESKIEYTNPAFTTITGYKAEEVLGRKTRILKSGKTDDAVYKDLWETISKGIEWHGEWINRKKNGELYWENVSITPIHNENGILINYLAIKQDISERKRTEKELLLLNENLELRIAERTSELEKSKEQLENFFSVALDLLCIADTSANFIKVNKAWETILGYTKKELENRKFLDFVHPDDLQPTLNAMAELSEQNPILDFTNRYQTRGGDYRFIEWHSVPVGNLIYAAARDITERIMTEKFEEELLQISLQMMGLPISEVRGALDMSLARVGKYLDADRSYIFEFDHEKGTMSNTHEWCAEGISAEKSNLQDMPIDLFPHWFELLEKHEAVVIPSVKNLPDSWKGEKDILIDQGIKSALVIPALSENRLIGFVGLDSVRHERVYSEDEIRILWVWGGMLASLINNVRSGLLLEQTRQNYTTFFNTINDFLYVLDLDGNIIDTNQTLRTRLNYEQEELTGKSIVLLHPENRQDESRIILQRIIEGLEKVCTIPLVTREGGLIPVETKVYKGNWNGKTALFGVCKDVTEKEISEQKFSSAFQGNPSMMAISLFDEGDYLDCNNAFLDALGFTREEIIGSSNRKLGLFVDHDLRKEVLEQLNAGIPVRKKDILMRRKDGEIRNGMMSAEIIYVGTRKCIITTTMDVTDLKETEAQLKLARIEAENANAAKSEFLSRMSHELRTPMNSILGFAQLLEMGELMPVQKKGVSHIIHSGKHLLNLINEVLDISRIEAGRLSISLEPVEVNGVVLEMIDTIRPLAKERSITVEFGGNPENLEFIRVDRQRLKQILLNILNNAVKYNRTEGFVRINLQTTKEFDGDKGKLRISISDTGVGIAEEDLPKLFVPFERIGADKTETEGTGLGLAVVKKLVDALGGTLGVISEKDIGSTFWIEFPRVKQATREIPVIGDEQGKGHSVEAKSGLVIYVEDNRPNIELVQQVIENYCPNVKLVTHLSGLGARELIEKSKPDLVLLDHNLPGKNGDEILRELRMNRMTKDIPVVIISADAMPKQVEFLMNLGANRYLTKPLEINGLIDVINEFVL